jgi:hypothetical protein
MTYFIQILIYLHTSILSHLLLFNFHLFSECRALDLIFEAYTENDIASQSHYHNNNNNNSNNNSNNSNNNNNMIANKQSQVNATVSIYVVQKRTCCSILSLHLLAFLLSLFFLPSSPFPFTPFFSFFALSPLTTIFPFLLPSHSLLFSSH